MIIDGKLVAEKIKNDLKYKIIKNNIEAKLSVILVGDNDASRIYVRNKIKACEKVGIRSDVIKLNKDISENELIDQVKKLNNDSEVTGILVQLPLPKHINAINVINTIDYRKDVDGFHPVNLGKMIINQECSLPCTPKGIIRLMEHYGIEIEGKNVVILGRSNIVGKPIAALLINMGATVSVLNSKTKNLSDYTKKCDILISAMGRAKFINSSHIDKCEVVIDVGMNRDGNGRLCGDIDFDDIKNKVKLITPVPGGVGPMTIAMLLENCISLKESYGII